MGGGYMRCGGGEEIRQTINSLGAALAFNGMALALMDATNDATIGIRNENRMKEFLIQGGEILKRVINPTFQDLDLADLFDLGTEDIKWYYEHRRHMDDSFLSRKEMKNLWQWMEKKETRKVMKDKTNFLGNLIKVLEELAQGKKKTRSGEVLFLTELFSIFWYLLTYNKRTTVPGISIMLR